MPELIRNSSPEFYSTFYPAFVFLGNKMTIPSVNINPPYKEYYEGDRIELECVTTGIPRPSITWQRASNRALPQSVDNYETSLVIESATEEDSGEYR